MNTPAQVWPFINPAFVGAALAAGLIPVLIHLIHRRRYTRMPWAAMRFLLAASRRSAKRVWLEQFLLLATRVAVIVLFGLAVARPYVPASALLPFRASSVHRILILDNSLSMNAALEDGRTRFSAAKQTALTLLDSFPAADAVSLITVAEPAEALIGHPAHDRRFVRDQLSALESTWRSGDDAGAFQAAIEILNESEYPPRNRVVYLLSDLPSRVWIADPDEESARGTSAEPQTTIASAAVPPLAVHRAARRLADLLPEPSSQWVVVRVAVTGGSQDAGPGENLAVTAFEQSSPLIGAAAAGGSQAFAARFVATVTNFGSRPAAGHLLQIRLCGRILRAEPLPDIAPGDSRAITFATELTAPGTHLIEARILTAGTADQAETEVDMLADDNLRYLSVEVRETRKVLLVDGRPGSGAPGSSGETAFLATAVAPRVRIDRALRPLLFQPKVVTEAALAREPLGDYDVIALCNVRRLSADNWKRLEAYVRAGGSLMVFPGDLVDPDHYNEFGYADGNSVLPVRLLAVHQGESRSAPPPGGRAAEDRKAGASTGWIGFAPADLTHPIVAEFSGRPESSLFTARVEQYYRIDRGAPVSPQAHVVLRYTDGAEALIATSLERGRILLFTTTADMGWTNLPAKGDYVSLMLNSLAWLAPQHGEHRNLRVGQIVQERLSAVESSLPLQIVDADGAAVEPRLVPDEDAMFLQFGPVEKPGPVQVSIGRQTRTFAVNVDPAESDLRTVDEASFRSALAREVGFLSEAGAPFLSRSSPATPGGPTAGYATELAPMLIAAVFGFLLIESLLAMWFGARGRGSS